VACIAGIYLLAARLTRRPMLAAMTALASPAFFVSATNGMSDVLMLALWTWAVLLWVIAMQEDQPRLLLASGALVALAALTKYPAISLIPLLIAYGLAIAATPRGARMWWQVGALAIPVLVLIVYQIMTARMYGHGLLSDAGEYATSFRAENASSKIAQTVTALAFTGGGLLAPALILCVTSWRVALVGALVAIASAFDMPSDVQRASMSGLGAVILAGAAWELWVRRDPEALLIALWIWGVFVFAAYVNWVINARSVVPMTPAACVLAARAAPKLWPRIAIALAAVVTLLVTMSDDSLANSSRRAAELIATRTHGKVWFTGHWGFQYYMQRYAQPWDNSRTRCEVGDWIAIDLKTSSPAALPPAAVELVDVIELPLTPRIGSTFNRGVRACFYADNLGPKPYGFGAVWPQRFPIYRCKAVIRAVRGVTSGPSAESPSTRRSP
jgi:hypothetical protein